MALRICDSGTSVSPPDGAGTDAAAGLGAAAAAQRRAGPTSGCAGVGWAAWSGGGLGLALRGLLRWCRRLGPALDERENVVARDAPTGAGAGQLRDVDVVLADEAPHRRRHARGAVAAATCRGMLRGLCVRRRCDLLRPLWFGLCRRGRSSSGRRRLLLFDGGLIGAGCRIRLRGLRLRGRLLRLGLCGRRLGLCGLRLGLGFRGGRCLGGRCLACRRFRGAGLGVDLGDRGTDGDGLPVGDQDLRDRPGDLGRNLGIHLVGDDLEERVVLLDGVAFLDQPALDRAFGDRFAELGHLDRGCHRGAFLWSDRSLRRSAVRIVTDCRASVSVG